MIYLDTLGGVAYVLILLGTWIIGKKHRAGWVIKGAGDLIWLGIGLKLGLYSIWLAELAFLSMDIWYFFRWNEAAKRQK